MKEEDDGTRSLTRSGLLWLLRSLDCLLRGAESAEAAGERARGGKPLEEPLEKGKFVEETKGIGNLRRCLEGARGEIWPLSQKQKQKQKERRGDSKEEEDAAASSTSTSTSTSSAGAALSARERGRIAREKMLAKIASQQALFAESGEAKDEEEKGKEGGEEETCIICSSSGGTGTGSPPLGRIAHVQRSRVLGWRNCFQRQHQNKNRFFGVVVGEKGCQLRESCEGGSAKMALLERGTEFEVMKYAGDDDEGGSSNSNINSNSNTANNNNNNTTTTTNNNNNNNNNNNSNSNTEIKSRRMQIRSIQTTTNEVVSTGWANSTSSSNSLIGYKILSFPSSGAVSSSSSSSSPQTFGPPTRPLLKTCGHSAHVSCVDTLRLTSQQKLARGHMFEEKYAANISEGEFLCPLCKQISNAVVPGRQELPKQEVREGGGGTATATATAGGGSFQFQPVESLPQWLENFHKRSTDDDSTRLLLPLESQLEVGAFYSELYNRVRPSWSSSFSSSMRSSQKNALHLLWSGIAYTADCTESGGRVYVDDADEGDGSVKDDLEVLMQVSERRRK